MSSRKRLIEALLERHGRTFADELGVTLRNTPAPLFRILCMALLTSAPVQSDIAMRAARALGDAGWTTPAKLRDSRWSDRVRVLNEAGYARVDEKTATQLATLVDDLMTRYGGDLRRLRREADGRMSAARDALMRFKGIGDVGAAIFVREVQAVWPEFYPFADKAALKAAKRLGLPDDAATLAADMEPDTYVRLVAALVRTQLEKDFDLIAERA